MFAATIAATGFTIESVGGFEVDKPALPAGAFVARIV
jgi:hypothetical protein